LPKRRRRRGMPDTNTFGGRLRLARLRSGLSQDEVGELMGLSGRSVSQWELGTTRPAKARLKSIADLYHITLEWLTDPLGADIAAVPSAKETTTDSDSAEALAANRQRFLAASVRLAPNRPDVEIVLEIHENEFLPDTKDLRTLMPVQEWYIPRALLRNVPKIADVRIMRITQDAAAPLINSGEYLLIDCSIHSPHGTRWLYICNDRLAVFVRYIEAVINPDNGETVHYQLTPENPSLKTRTVKAADLNILGRVIGTIRLFI
jgi:transcriptional regulator with XRE-family HTH domain